MKTNVFYAADGEHGTRKCFPDDAATRQQCLAEGLRFFSVYSYSHAFKEGQSPPIIYGDLWILFTCPDDVWLAVKEAKGFIDHLVLTHSDVPVGRFSYEMYGPHGLLIGIPAYMMNAESGSPVLPQIYRKMLDLLLPPPDLFDPRSWIDYDLYRGPEIKLLLAAGAAIPGTNMLRGKTDPDMLFKLSYGMAQGAEPCGAQAWHDETEGPQRQPVPSLSKLFTEATKLWEAGLLRCKPIEALEDLEKCSFIRHCHENAAELPEPEWHALVSIMSHLGRQGRNIITEYSRQRPGYQPQDLNRILHSHNICPPPLSCLDIKQVFDCGKSCNVHSPVALWFQRRSQEVREHNGAKFQAEPDGVYFSPENNDSSRQWLCSSLRVIAKSRDADSQNWGRLLTMFTPDGQLKELHLPMADFSGYGENIIGKLLDSGVEISPHPNARKLLIQYLQSTHPERLVRLIPRCGWYQGKIYILPDQSFGNSAEEEYRLSAKGSHKFKVSGTLRDWQDNIAKPALASQLLVLVLAYAFTGVLLRSLGMEGGGLHIYGHSSTGKTTALLVAGSVCGGGGNHGFLAQWRATDNSLEATAALHNDNLLCLDEIGQAHGKVVSEVAYMLANGQGKGRASRDGYQKKRHEWMLSFLSSGEVTLDDKISDGGSRAYAGQLVRVLDIPADAGKEQGIFDNLSPADEAGKLAAALSQASCRYYGQALRCFLEKLMQDYEANVLFARDLLESIDWGHKKYPQMSPQVSRGRKRFALIAAAGELAIRFGILPWPEGTAVSAARQFFARWVNSRGGLENSEIQMVKKAIRDYFEKYSLQRFINLDDPVARSCVPANFAGYKWQEKGGHTCYLVLSSIVQEQWCKNMTMAELTKELDKSGYLARNSKGNIMESKHIPSENKNRRGLVFVPAAWENKP